MPLSLYEASVPVFLRGLDTMARLLDKGRAWAEEQGVPLETLTEARLIDDMKPLTAQVQFACDAAKFAGARLADTTGPVMEDNETTFDDLQARVAATIAFLKTVVPSAMDGREDAEVVLKFPNGQMTFRGVAYLQQFAIPNFFFHVTTLYAILRSKGVPLAKMDYLGSL